MRPRLLQFVLACLLSATLAAEAQTDLISAGSSWSYLRGTAEASNPISAWRMDSFVENGWLTGVAPFYYTFTPTSGTLLADMKNGYTSVFLRQKFNVSDPALIGKLILNSTIDDAFIAWINGVEVARSNIAVPVPVFNSVSTTSLAASPAATVTNTLPDPRTYLTSGSNTLAIMTFNSAIGGSDFYADFKLTTSGPDSTVPVLVSVTPPPGSTVGSLPQITVVFSESVRGVTADDLFINQNPATSVSGSGTTWTFVVPVTANGPVNVSFNPAHGISDEATPAHDFDHAAANATWSYAYIDQQPPVVALLNPPAGSTVISLSQIEVLFDETVSGVSAADLLVGGTPATGISNPSPGRYFFTFPARPPGPVTIAWAAGHGIADAVGNNFAGGSWSYTVDPTALSNGIRINEIVAGNQAGIVDENGEPQDWVEIYNPTASTVNLNGWSLSDDESNSEEWIFPAWTLGPGKYLVVFCSGKDRRPAQTTAGADNAGTAASPRLHTNFGLSCPGGEFLALYNNQSPRVAVTSFAPAYPEQRNDTGYGLDGTGVWRYFSPPTPGVANGSSTVAGVTDEVIFNVNHGFFKDPFQLYFSCPTPGAAIRYTLDGSVPTVSTGLLYTGSVQIDRTTSVRAAAFGAGRLSSRVSTKTYIFPAGVRNQPVAPAGFPTSWGPVLADYEVDPTVTGSPLYSATFESDLLAIPSMSIVMKQDDMFGPNGINTNSGNSGIAWERAASLELIFPDGRDGFQQDCGMRIQGGYGRTQSILKHSFRPLFKGDYGESKLKFPLFPGSPVDEFDTFTLRAGMNNSFVLSTGEAVRATFTEDEWMRQTQRAMGQVSGYGAFFHLYINGLYWGLYNATERPSAPFAAAHLGGDKSEWDALNSSEAVDGLKTAWTSLQTLCSSGANVRYTTDQADWNGIMQYLDVDNLIDYMLLNFYGGNADWDDHNWYAARRRVTGAGYKFFSWDGERTLESSNSDRTAVNQADKPSRVYAALRGSTSTATAPLNAANVEFRFRFADHIQKHLFNTGPLTPTEALNRWNSIEAQVDRAVVGESARWGDKLREPPYTRNAEFLTEVNRKRSSQFSGRTASALTQLRNAKLYPPTTLVAPSFSQFGGKVALGYNLAITSSTSGTIFYTLDGSDPRQSWSSVLTAGSAVEWSGSAAASAVAYSAPLVLQSTATVRARVKDATGLWSALTEATFQVGEVGIPLRITEIMYNPIGGDAYEFIEVMNLGATPLDLSLLSFEGVNFIFLRGTTLAAGQRAVLASDLSPALWAARYPGVTPIGYFSGSLSNGGEYLAIKDATGNVVTSFFYDDEGRWPAAADGGGSSLENIDPSGDPRSPESWRASVANNGTPGLPNQTYTPPAVRFNEVLARNGGAINQGGVVADYVELYNFGTVDVDLGGWSVRSQGFLTGACIFPAQTILPAGGYLVVWAGNVPGGFKMLPFLPDQGGLVTLNDQTGALADIFEWGPQIVDKSIGRSAGSWVLTEPTPGASNVVAAVASPSKLAINEFLAQPDAFIYQAPFVEVANTDASLPVALHGMYVQVGSGVRRVEGYSFIAPGGFALFYLNSSGLDLALPATNGVISLLNPSAVSVATLSYANSEKGISQGRLPNGTGAVTRFPNNATPGTANTQITYSGPLLNEIMARNEGAVTDAFHNWPDWIELANAGATPFDMAGMILRLDETTEWTFPSGSIVPPGGFLRIWCDPLRPLDATNTHVALNDRGGGVRLFNAAGQQVDAISYGPQAANLSFGITGGQWRLLTTPTPGAPNSAAATLGSATALRINEWQSAGAGNDWLELYNTGTQAVELSGLYLSDDPSLAGRNKSVIRARSFIAPHGTALFQATGNADDAPNATSFALSNAGESIRLYAANLDLIDGVDFGEAVYETSRGRYPDGANTFVNFITTRSPDAPNYLDRDGDGLPDAWEIAYGLDPDVADATSDLDGDGFTNLEEYRAGSDPRDPLSTIATALSTEVAAGGGFLVRFTAQAGKTYTIQWKASLADPAWQKLVDVPADILRLVEITDVDASLPARFYRVVTPRQ